MNVTPTDVERCTHIRRRPRTIC